MLHMYAQSDLHMLFVAGTAERSVIFTRWCQCAHPTIHCSLSPRVGPLNGILIVLAVFALPTIAPDPTVRAAVGITCVSPSPLCTDCSVVYLQACKSVSMHINALYNPFCLNNIAL